MDVLNFTNQLKNNYLQFLKAIFQKIKSKNRQKMYFLQSKLARIFVSSNSIV